MHTLPFASSCVERAARFADILTTTTCVRTADVAQPVPDVGLSMGVNFTPASRVEREAVEGREYAATRRFSS